MTITEFLEARIAEDEAALERRGAFPHSTHGMDEVGAYDPRCPDCLGLPGKARVLAECKAKRAIIKHAIAIHEVIEGEWGGGRTIGEEGWQEDNLGTDVIRSLASVYADHPAYPVLENVGVLPE
jgi:hypothetical protein